MQATFKSYLIGFALSLILTGAAFFLVLRPGFFHMGSEAVVASILILAVIQLFVHLTFFLQLWSELGPRWNLVVFISTLVIILIMVAGSLWIMNHLNYNMMPDQMNSYLLQQEGF